MNIHKTSNTPQISSLSSTLPVKGAKETVGEFKGLNCPRGARSGAYLLLTFAPGSVAHPHGIRGQSQHGAASQATQRGKERIG